MSGHHLNVKVGNMENYDQEEIKDMIKFSRHIHVNDQSGKDTCKTCGHDLRHKIHLRYGEDK